MESSNTVVGAAFTYLYLAVKERGGVGIAVGFGKRYSNICIVQEDH